MIEPTPKDRGRKVQWRGADGQVAGTGTIENFSVDYVFVRTQGQLDPMPRHQLDWAPEHNAAAHAAAIEQQATAARKAARQILEAAGLAIEEIDAHTWNVGGYLLKPALGSWTRPDGTIGYGGARALASAAKLTPRPRPMPAPGDLDSPPVAAVPEVAQSAAAEGQSTSELPPAADAIDGAARSDEAGAAIDPAPPGPSGTD